MKFKNRNSSCLVFSTKSGVVTFGEWREWSVKRRQKGSASGLLAKFCLMNWVVATQTLHCAKSLNSTFLFLALFCMYIRFDKHLKKTLLRFCNAIPHLYRPPPNCLESTALNTLVFGKPPPTNPGQCGGCFYHTLFTACGCSKCFIAQCSSV